MAKVQSFSERDMHALRSGQARALVKVHDPLNRELSAHDPAFGLNTEQRARLGNDVAALIREVGVERVRERTDELRLARARVEVRTTYEALYGKEEGEARRRWLAAAREEQSDEITVEFPFARGVAETRPGTTPTTAFMHAAAQDAVTALLKASGPQGSVAAAKALMSKMQASVHAEGSSTTYGRRIEHTVQTLELCLSKPHIFLIDAKNYLNGLRPRERQIAILRFLEKSLDAGRQIDNLLSTLRVIERIAVDKQPLQDPTVEPCFQGTPIAANGSVALVQAQDGGVFVCVKKSDASFTIHPVMTKVDPPQFMSIDGQAYAKIRDFPERYVNWDAAPGKRFSYGDKMYVIEQQPHGFVVTPVTG